MHRRRRTVFLIAISLAAGSPAPRALARPPKNRKAVVQAQPAQAMTPVTSAVDTESGIAGTDGAPPTAGGNATASAVSIDPSNTAVATGGNGGSATAAGDAGAIGGNAAATVGTSGASAGSASGGGSLSVASTASGGVGGGHL